MSRPIRQIAASLTYVYALAADGVLYRRAAGSTSDQWEEEPPLPLTTVPEDMGGKHALPTHRFVHQAVANEAGRDVRAAVDAADAARRALRQQDDARMVADAQRAATIADEAFRQLDREAGRTGQRELLPPGAAARRRRPGAQTEGR